MGHRFFSFILFMTTFTFVKGDMWGVFDGFYFFRRGEGDAVLNMPLPSFSFIFFNWIPLNYYKVLNPQFQGCVSLKWDVTKLCKFWLYFHPSHSRCHICLSMFRNLINAYMEWNILVLICLRLRSKNIGTKAWNSIIFSSKLKLHDYVETFTLSRLLFLHIWQISKLHCSST